MFQFLRSRENIPLFIAAAVALGALLAWLSPAEATLGNAVKLVYVHAALMWVGFGLLTFGGFAGATFLVWRKDALIFWSTGSEVMGLALLLGTGVLGAVTAKITWGSVFWAEPRMMMLGQILIAGIVAFLSHRLSGSKVVAGTANVFVAVVAWVLVLRTEKVVHPDSPIFASDSAAIKIFPLLITAIIAIAAVLAIRYWVSGERS